MGVTTDRWSNASAYDWLIARPACSMDATTGLGNGPESEFRSRAHHRRGRRRDRGLGMGKPAKAARARVMGVKAVKTHAGKITPGNASSTVRALCGRRVDRYQMATLSKSPVNCSRCLTLVRTKANPSSATGGEGWRSSSTTPIQTAIRKAGGLAYPRDSTATEWREVARLKRGLMKRGGSPVDEVAEALGYETSDHLRQELIAEITLRRDGRARRVEDLSFAQMAARDREQAKAKRHRVTVYEVDRKNWVRSPSSPSLRRGVVINPAKGIRTVNAELRALLRGMIPRGGEARITLTDRELGALRRKFPIPATQRAAVAADTAWSRELERTFGKEAGAARFQDRGKGKPGSKLRRLYQAWIKAVDKHLAAQMRV